MEEADGEGADSHNPTQGRPRTGEQMEEADREGADSQPTLRRDGREQVSRGRRP
ncbi:hypothetical protein B0H10DRAFT_2027250, partial [Mycena sp. CBHHK59/15]